MHATSRQIVHAMLGYADSVGCDRDLAPSGVAKATQAVPADPATDLAHCFLRVANLPNDVFDRLSRYEVTLWRQVGQVLFALDNLDRRKPQERSRRLLVRSRQEQPDYGGDEC